MADDQITSPGLRLPPKRWWLENASRVAAFRMRHARSLSANTIPLREHIKDAVEFVRIVWDEIERSVTQGDQDR
jgi:hypothetical protein